MAAISSPGIGSNLDVKSIVSQLMAVERQPLTLLDVKEASFNAKLSVFGTMKSALFSLQTAAQNINISSAFKTLKATVADSSVLTATVSGATAPGAFNIEVQKLAQSQKLISAAPGYAATSTIVGSGTLTLTLGTYTGPTTFVANPAETGVTLTIDATNNTLAGIRDAINASAAGVTASIINNGSANYLSLTSKDTGASNALNITATNSGGAGLSDLVYDPTTPLATKLVQNVAAQDAMIKVDGITITKASNTITDAIEGVTLNLAKEMTPGSTTKLTLARDNTGAHAAIDAFVKAYNDVNKQIADATAYNASTGAGSPLTGDATARSIQTQLRSALSNAISGAPNGLSTLTDAGINFQKDGTLLVNSSKLDSALSNTTLDLSKLFTTNGSTIGYASRLNTLLGSMITGTAGTVNSRIDSINNSIKGIDTQRISENARMDKIEAAYNAQFTALDVTISGMTSTSNFLTQQFNSMSKSTG